jgi:hypothetical protein
MYKILPAILTFFILSCNSTGDKYKLDQDSQNVYNLALDYTTGSDTSVSYHLRIPPMPPPVSEMEEIDSLERAQLSKWEDSLKSVLDTTKMFVVVNHKIDTLSSSDITNILETITSNKDNLQYKMNGDTSFNESLRKLCNNKLSFDTIDVTKLKTKFNYKIYSDRCFPKDKVRQMGTVTFSKIAFSSQKNKAAVYTSFVCGGLCGTGQILFFKKLNGIWKYVRVWEMWIA